MRDRRVRLFTTNGNVWTKRYPRIVEEAARLRAPLIIDAEVVHLTADGVSDFDALHSRIADEKAVALAFDLLLSGEDIRRQRLIERKTALKWVLRKAREGIQYVEHAEGHGAKFCRRLQSRPRGDRVEAAYVKLHIGAVEILDQGQEPEGSCCKPRP